MSLSVRDVDAGYGGLTVLRGVDVDAAAGELVVVLGANGAGKSTLLDTIAGLVVTTAGSVRLGGRDATVLAPEQRTALGFALVPEGRHLFGTMSVRDNLLLGGHLRRRDRHGTAAALREVCELYPALVDRLGQRANTLSGGQQQMVAIGRALMSRPKVLALDEPSLGLAPILVAELLETLTRLRDEGMAVLLVEQHAALALQHADRAYVLDRGQVVREGPGDELAADAAVRAAYLGGPP
jgi:branched-chain amino acid transport system ATP-binding protein